MAEIFSCYLLEIDERLTVPEKFHLFDSYQNAVGFLANFVYAELHDAIFVSHISLEDFKKSLFDKYGSSPGEMVDIRIHGKRVLYNFYIRHVHISGSETSLVNSPQLKTSQRVAGATTQGISQRKIFSRESSPREISLSESSKMIDENSPMIERMAILEKMMKILKEKETTIYQRIIALEEKANSMKRAVDKIEKEMKDQEITNGSSVEQFLDL